MRIVEDGVKSALESVLLHLLLDVIVDEAADVCEDVRDLIRDQDGLKIRLSMVITSGILNSMLMKSSAIAKSCN